MKHITYGNILILDLQGETDSHGGVAPRGIEDVVPFLLGQLAVTILVSLVEHLLDLKTMSVVEVEVEDIWYCRIMFNADTPYPYQTVIFQLDS